LEAVSNQISDEKSMGVVSAPLARLGNCPDQQQSRISCPPGSRTPRSRRC
jgi:hypothetical protein